MRGLLRSPAFLLNAIAPMIAYRVLTGRGMASIDALALAALFPAAGALYALARQRRLDTFAALALVVIGIGLVTDRVFHNGRILLVRESVITGALGLVCLGSLFFARRVFGLRRRTTAIWGVALLTEAAVRVGLSYVLPTATFVTISPLLALVFFGPLGLATLRRRPTSNPESEIRDEPEPRSAPVPARRRPAGAGPALPGTTADRTDHAGAHEHG